jgi:hypothetical protein
MKLQADVKNHIKDEKYLSDVKLTDIFDAVVEQAHANFGDFDEYTNNFLRQALEKSIKEKG